MSVSYATVNGQLVQESRDGVVCRYIPDTLGSVIQTRDASGIEISQVDFWPYGEVRSPLPSPQLPWAFVGTLGYMTENDGNLYVRSRYYLSGLGRWATPSGLNAQGDGEQTYGYADDDPIAYVDPIGQRPQKKRTPPKVYSQPGLGNCQEGKDCVAVLVRYSGGGRFEGNYTGCFKKDSTWRDSVLDCACKYGISPVALMALMYIESHYGTAGGPERCANPVSYHFCEKGTLMSLRYESGELPSLKDSICAGARTVKRDGGFKEGTWGQAGLVDSQYKLFLRLCKEKGLA